MIQPNSLMGVNKCLIMNLWALLSLWCVLGVCLLQPGSVFPPPPSGAPLSDVPVTSGDVLGHSTGVTPAQDEAAPYVWLKVRRYLCISIIGTLVRFLWVMPIACG